mmetsp:Transcript_42411/g.76997  ORF Transcript_42411/g.76997 Transcript_42411/m.76997 type:complete len:195 (+) Transcript_42411:68-652(+)
MKPPPSIVHSCCIGIVVLASNICGGLTSAAALAIAPMANWMDTILSHRDRQPDFLRAGYTGKPWGPLLPVGESSDLPTTDTGRTEAPTSVGVRDWRAPARTAGRAGRPCEPECHGKDICWDGTCLYRPWAFHDEPRPSCVANPEVPGLTKRERLLCEGGEAEISLERCLGVAPYCIWAVQGPMWFFRENGMARP